MKESWLSKLGEYSIAIQKLLAKEFFLKLVTGIQIYARAIEVEPSVKVAGMPAANFRLAVNESIKLSYIRTATANVEYLKKRKDSVLYLKVLNM